MEVREPLRGASDRQLSNAVGPELKGLKHGVLHDLPPAASVEVTTISQ